MPESEKAQFSVDEITKRILRIEDRLMSIEDNISEINDLQLINKLDIINLKNTIEGLMIGMSGAIEAKEKPKPKAKAKPVQPRPVPVPAEAKPAPKNMCKNCGAWVPPNAKFCTKCGRRAQ